MDEAQILPPDAEERLNAELAGFERRTRHQLVVVTKPSLENQPIERYSLALANQLAIGRKRYNDGVMLLVAPHERKVRIEVGKGLENALTNEEAARILEKDVLPALGRGDFPLGIEAGAKAIIGEAS